jgi:hypothetical protein
MPQNTFQIGIQRLLDLPRSARSTLIISLASSFTPRILRRYKLTRTGCQLRYDIFLRRSPAKMPVLIHFHYA